MPYQWPSCQHPIHLGCLLHLMTRRLCPTCPTCREPWSPDTNLQLEQTRRATNVEWPVPEIPEHEHSPRDRTPNPPPDIIPLCCPRPVLIDPTQPELDSSWRELPSRHMDWTPNMDQTTGSGKQSGCVWDVTTMSPEHTPPFFFFSPHAFLPR